MTSVYAVLALMAIGLLAVAFVALRLLRRRGKVRCVVWDWELRFFRGGEPGGQAVLSFEGYLLNEGSLPTSLHDARVLFVRDGAREVIGHLRHSDSDEDLQVLNLPSCRGVYVSLYATFEGEEAREVPGFWRADLVGRFPNGRIFRRKIAGREDFMAARKKVSASRKDFAASLKKLAASRKNFVADRKRVGAGRKNYARLW